MICVAGILNVTPDSFYDGGRHASVEGALERGLRMWEEGADVIDVGAVSTRPGAADVSVQEELDRALPVVEGLVAEGCAVSIDTWRAAVARPALQAGAGVVNDVMGLRDPGMIEVIAEAGAGAVIMHMRGTPATMQRDTRYDSVLHEVSAFLAERLAAARAGGVKQLWLDPGFGFGKDLAGNLALLRGLPELAKLGAPLYVGVSRKSSVGAVLGGAPAEGRLFGSIGVALAAVSAGAAFLRVHDVAATREALMGFCAVSGHPLSPGRAA